MSDLREHFGIWDRCGNTRFFKKDNPWSEIYLNPLDGVLVSARRAKLDRDSPRYELVVKDARKAEKDAVDTAYDANKPWVRRAVKQFFYLKAIGWALDVVKKHAGKDPIPGDRDLGNFLRAYKSGGKPYREQGSMDEIELDDPFLEEVLEAIYRMLGAMDGATVDYGRNLSEEDLEEALGYWGILECA